MASLVSGIKSCGFELHSGFDDNQHCACCGKPCTRKCSACKMGFCDLNCTTLVWPKPHQQICQVMSNKNLASIIRCLCDESNASRGQAMLCFISNVSTPENQDTHSEAVSSSSFIFKRVAEAPVGLGKIPKEAGAYIHVEDFLWQCDPFDEKRAYQVVKTTGDLRPIARAAYHSGCLGMFGLLFSLFIVEKPHPYVSSRVMSLYLRIFSAIVHRSRDLSKIYGMSFGVDNALPDCVAQPLPDLLRKNLTNDADQAAIYLVSLTPESTNPVINSQHFFLLLRCGTSSQIIQSYFGQYDHFTWCTEDLSLRYLDSSCPPTSKEHILQDTCKYRGQLDDSLLSMLCDDLEALTSVDSCHIQLYQDITGVRCTKQVLGTRFIVSYSRLDLTKNHLSSMINTGTHK